jgi:predicted TIM-barrel fold metal-dependent hydrolase
MLIVDSQVHIWNSGKLPTPIHRQVPVFSKDDLLKEMDEAGVDAALLHPPAFDPNSDAVAIEAARQHPNRLAVLGRFPVERPESRALVDTWKNQPGMLGLRFVFLQPHQQKWPTDGTMDWLWPAAERAGIPIALFATSFLPAL